MPYIWQRGEIVQNTHTESEALNVKQNPNVLKSVGRLLNVINKDSRNMDDKIFLILYRSWQVGTRLLELEMTRRGLTKIGLKTSE